MAPPAEEATRSDPVERIGRYRVLKRLASGGMGEVFLARQEGPAGFSKILVIKRIRSELASDPHFVSLFLREARLAALLSHPNVVQIFELGEEGGSYFIAMEHVHGKPLSTMHRELTRTETAFGPIVAAELCRQALLGLHDAHELRDDRGRPLGIVHRDISPDNILVGFNGVVKLVDFGIAQAESLGRERRGVLQGKLAYMSPEQLTGGTVDARSDLYSLGVVLYQLLTGELPFESARPEDRLRLSNGQHIRPIRERVPSISQELELITLTALAASPDARFSSAKEMASALQEFLVRDAPGAGPGTVETCLKRLFPSECDDTHVSVSGPKTQPLRGPSELVTEVHSPTHAFAPPRARRLPILLGVTAMLTGALIVGGRLLSRLETSETQANASFATSARPLPPHAEREPTTARGTRPSRERAADESSPTAVSKGTANNVPRTSAVESGTPARTPAKRTGSGTVEVRVHPWAEVIWNGRSMGTTPLAPLRVPAGRQQFLLRNDALKRERLVTVTVQPGRPSTLSVNLME